MTNIPNWLNSQAQELKEMVGQSEFEMNFDAFQPDRPKVTESDAQVKREEVRREQAYEHATNQ